MAEGKRSANFTSTEETILLCLVKKYKDILENKKTDSKMNKNKLECWKQIETEFNNDSGHIFRDTLILRKKYENLKKRTKKKFADEKCYALGTGGGPPKNPSEMTDIDREIKEILAERIDGFPSEFGGDAEIITIMNMPDDNMNNPFVDEMQEERIDISNREKSDVTENKPDWTKSTVENSKTPKSRILNTGEGSNKRKRNEYDAMCGKVSQWAASKADLESEKIRFAEEEHKIKIEMLEKKCNLECELMRKESEAKVQILEREAEVTLEGIRESNKLKKEILLLEKHVMMQKVRSASKLDNS